MATTPYKRIGVNGKCIYEHRYVMEQYLGRELLPTEQIHHINGDKRDNRIENLQLIDIREHTKLHHQIYPDVKRCVVCGKEFVGTTTQQKKTKKTCSEECCQVLREELWKRKCKPVIQFSKDGKQIAIWESAAEVQRATGIPFFGISDCCHHEIKSYYGFVWEFAEVKDEVS